MPRRPDPFIQSNIYPSGAPGFPGAFLRQTIEKQAGNASQESLDQAADAEGFGCSFEGFIV
jgi:hypothetical protein